jgi:predicted nucleic acid-binding protein
VFRPAASTSHSVRHSAVVLSELRRGARGREQRRIVERLHDAAQAIWEPSTEDWWEAGRLARDIGDRAGWETSKRREFQNDALIALTAVRHGATVITANRDDFSLLKARLKVELIYA